MGGNALKQYNTRRYSKTEYFQLWDKLQGDLFNLFGHTGYLIPAYHSKETFGDLDCIYDSQYLPTDWVIKLVNYFKLADAQWVKHGNVLSFGLNNFQIDLIVMPTHDVQSSLNYYSYNDLGNLLGRLYHKLGIKYGHRGLSLIVRGNPNYILEEIPLTHDLHIILDILNLSYDKFEAGFDTLEDIFDYVISSTFFDKACFILDNRSHISRVRDKKRATYNAFLKYISAETVISKYSFGVKTEHGGYSIREPYYSEIVIKRFPFVADKVSELTKRYELDQEFKKIYNGNLISQMTGLSDKALGQFMSNFKFNQIEKQYYLDHTRELYDMILNSMAS